MFLHKQVYEKRAINEAKSKLKAMLAGLDEELRAGQAPTDFKFRINVIYRDIMGACNYVYELP
jgi:hypothetical protein